MGTLSELPSISAASRNLLEIQMPQPILDLLSKELEWDIGVSFTKGLPAWFWCRLRFKNPTINPTIPKAGWHSRSLLDATPSLVPWLSQGPLSRGSKSLLPTLPLHLGLDGNLTVLGIIQSCRNCDWRVDFAEEAQRDGRMYLYHTRAREQVLGCLLETPHLWAALPFLGLFYPGPTHCSAPSGLIVISFGPSEFYLPVLVSHFSPTC